MQIPMDRPETLFTLLYSVIEHVQRILLSSSLQLGPVLVPLRSGTYDPLLNSHRDQLSLLRVKLALDDPSTVARPRGGDDVQQPVRRLERRRVPVDDVVQRGLRWRVFEVGRARVSFPEVRFR
jgi:hypothetical protein